MAHLQLSQFTQEWLLTWNVGDHDQNQERVVVKGEVVFVRKTDGVEASLPDKGQGRVDGEQLS